MNLTIGITTGGYSSHFWIEWGPTPKLGSRVAVGTFPGWQSANGAFGQQVLLPDEGRLKLGATYYVEVFAANKLGTVSSPVRSITLPTSATQR